MEWNLFISFNIRKKGRYRNNRKATSINVMQLLLVLFYYIYYYYYYSYSSFCHYIREIYATISTARKHQETMLFDFTINDINLALI
jgi:hypothetical protein